MEDTITISKSERLSRRFASQITNEPSSDELRLGRMKPNDIYSRKRAEIDFKDHFNISRYDLLPKKFAEAARAYWMTWEPSTNTKMKIMKLNSFDEG